MTIKRICTMAMKLGYKSDNSVLQEDGTLDVSRTHRSPSRNSQQSVISQLSTVSTPVTADTRTSARTTPTPSRRGSTTPGSGSTTPTQPAHSRQPSVRSRRGSGASTATQQLTPTQSRHGDTAATAATAAAEAGLVVNGDTAADTEPAQKHAAVNGNTSPLKSKLAADGSNNNDIDVPCSM